MTSPPHPLLPRLCQSGFSLVEISIVLIIVGLLFGAALTLLPGQLESQRRKDTEVLLAEARQAILGFAATNGRMPCPANNASNGYEAFCTNASGSCGAEISGPGNAPPSHGRCAVFSASTNSSSGFLPSLTLGLSGAISNGVSTDGWSGTDSNRIRYALSNRLITSATADWAPEVSRVHSSFYPFSAGIDANTGRTGLQDVAYNAGLNTLDAINGSFAPQLTVCSTATGSSSVACANAASTIAAAAVAVLYSVGPNAPTGGTGSDENHNPNPNGGSNDRVFVLHPPAMAGATNGEFDDQLIWLSGPELYNRLITVGLLP